MREFLIVDVTEVVIVITDSHVVGLAAFATQVTLDLLEGFAWDHGSDADLNGAPEEGSFMEGNFSERHYRIVSDAVLSVGSGSSETHSGCSSELRFFALECQRTVEHGERTGFVDKVANHLQPVQPSQQRQRR